MLFQRVFEWVVSDMLTFYCCFYDGILNAFHPMVIIQIIYFCTFFVHYFRVSASSGLIPSPTCATCAAVTIKESFSLPLL